MRIRPKILTSLRFDRRAFLQQLSAAGLAIATMPMLPRRARAEEQAIYYTWSDYNLPEFFPAYIEKNGAPPDTPLFGDNEGALQKLMSGFVADVTHPCSTMTARAG